MFAIDVSPDATVHRVCTRIANRVVFLVGPLLRGADERDAALREAYVIARDEIERHAAADGGNVPARRPASTAIADPLPRTEDPCR